jgi:hypothetical protein
MQHTTTTTTTKDPSPIPGVGRVWVCARGDETHCRSLASRLRLDNAMARVVTGCPRSTSFDALLAEAGLVQVALRLRQRQFAVRLLWRAWGFPAEYPLRLVAEGVIPARLKTTVGWREIWRAVLRDAEHLPC